MTTQQLFIDSEVGELQAELVTTQGNGTIAVLCHPHPLYGGSMHDAVLSVAAECAAHAGLSSLRFNFRGVGASAGQHQPAPSAPNEIADLLAVINWVKNESEHKSIVAIGYSFGACVVSHLMDHGHINRSILIAPPNAVMNCRMESNSQPYDVIYGGQDDYVDPSAYQQLADARLHELPDTDHFFSGAQTDLARTLSALLQALN